MTAGKGHPLVSLLHKRHGLVNGHASLQTMAQDDSVPDTLATQRLTTSTLLPHLPFPSSPPPLPPRMSFTTSTTHSLSAHLSYSHPARLYHSPSDRTPHLPFPFFSSLLSLLSFPSLFLPFFSMISFPATPFSDSPSLLSLLQRSSLSIRFTYASLSAIVYLFNSTSAPLPSHHRPITSNA